MKTEVEMLREKVAKLEAKLEAANIRIGFWRMSAIIMEERRKGESGALRRAMERLRNTPEEKDQVAA